MFALYKLQQAPWKPSAPSQVYVTESGLMENTGGTPEKGIAAESSIGSADRLALRASSAMVDSYKRLGTRGGRPL
ncbi:hypothetical protein DACRYDRAFT_24363, partial [Dacryopinax primogenitus]